MMTRRGDGIYLRGRIRPMTDRRLATFRAALALLVIAVHLSAAMPAHSQGRLDATGVQTCASLAQLIPDLKTRTVPTDMARQRLKVIYDIARTSSSPNVRQIASMQSGQLASADDTLLLMMAEQFASVACR